MATNDSVNHNVVGKIDGIRPIWLAEGLWHEWSMDEIFLDANYGGRDIGGGKIVPLYVPKVKDYIRNTTTHEQFQVYEVDEDTLIAKYRPINPNANSLRGLDILTARGPGYASADHKITIDTTVFPHTLRISPFLKTKAVEARYAKIISGSTQDKNLRIVGFMMNSAGELSDDKIPLDLVANFDGVSNYQLRTVRMCYTNEQYKNGDILTVVLYSATGGVLSENQLVVVSGNNLRDGTAPADYIRSVYIDSPYLSTSNPKELRLPMNWNSASMNMMGIVEYQSGRKVRLPIDGRKFKLDGSDQMLSTIAGHPFNMVLRYILERGEGTVTDVDNFNRTIPVAYRVVQTEEWNSYTVKLYAFPVWDVPSDGYRLKYFLVNLDRNEFIEVTGYVTPVEGRPVFDGYAYGVTQHIQVSLELRKVFSTYEPFVHTQAFEIALYGRPQDYMAPWTVKQYASDPKSYGGKLFAKKSADGLTLDITSGITDYQDWKQQMFTQSYPLLTDSQNPTSYPVPTHFDIRVGSAFTEFDIQHEWNLPLRPAGTLTDYSSIELIWKRKGVNEDMIISVSSLTVQPFK